MSLAAGSALTGAQLAEISGAKTHLARRTAVLRLGQRNVVVKRERPARLALGYSLLDLLAWLTGLPWLRGVPISSGSQGQADELRRLHDLGSSGVTVPNVLHVAVGYFVMDQAQGEDLASSLPRDPAAMRARWKLGLDFLQGAHRRGQYLSQAFARNLILTGQGLVAIDFEDDPLRKMSLSAAQTRDWLAYLHSTLWMLREQTWVVEDLTASLLQESPQVRSALLLTARRLGWMRMLPANRARWGRDLAGLQALARTMVQLEGRMRNLA